MLETRKEYCPILPPMAYALYVYFLYLTKSRLGNSTESGLTLCHPSDEVTSVKSVNYHPSNEVTSVKCVNYLPSDEVISVNSVNCHPSDEVISVLNEC